MATSKFSSIPPVFAGDTISAQYQTVAALKENVEMLIGTRGPNAISNRAVLAGQVTVQAPSLKYTGPTASGEGYSVGGQLVAGYSDYVKLLSDVQTLASDVATLQQTLTALINQIRGL